MEIRYCDMKGCSTQIHREGLRAKIRKGVGRLAGGDLDLCPEHREQLEAFVLGDSPDQAQPLPTTPRKPKPKPGSGGRPRPAA